MIPLYTTRRTTAYLGDCRDVLAYLHRTPTGQPIHPLARIKGVEVSKLVPLDWNTGEPLPLPCEVKP